MKYFSLVAALIISKKSSGQAMWLGGRIPFRIRHEASKYEPDRSKPFLKTNAVDSWEIRHKTEGAEKWLKRQLKQLRRVI